MSTSDDELFASPTKTSVEKPIKSLEEDSKADPILVKLIQEVKKERCLYDKSLKEYLNNTHKSPIWSRIAKSVGIEDGKKASKKGKNLRDGYARQDTFQLLLFNWLTKTLIREPISPEERLVVTLRFLATGESFRLLAGQFRMGISSVEYVVCETCLAIYEVLQPSISDKVADLIVKACCALHNFLIDEGSLNAGAMADTGLGNEPNGLWRTEVQNPLRSLQPAEMRRRGANRSRLEAEEVRQRLVRYFKEEGAVEWQGRMI